MADAIADQNMPEQAARPGAARHRPQVFLHIGEPKTGTTFLQQVMWSNRPALAAQGVVLPGHHPQDHFRASQDLRGIQKLPADPAGSWNGEWEILATQARQAGRVAVISHELFAAADPAEARRAVASLQPAEVHIVLTARDIATLLPAEWQETVKHRNSLGWEDWLEDVIDRESVARNRREFWFWRVHDTLAILDMWSREVPADRIHLITTAARAAGPNVLWDRFAGLLGVEPGSVDLSRARANASLGLAETEFLRRLNSELPDDVPDWFYMWNVKEALAHKALAARPAGRRLTLPADRAPWAAKHAEALITGLRDRSYDIIGDLDELLPPSRRARMSGRTSSRPRGAGRGGACSGHSRGKPVPQGLPGGQAAARQRRDRQPGRSGRVGGRVLAASEADAAGAQQPPLLSSPAAHPRVAGSRALEGEEERVTGPGSDARQPALADPPVVVAVLVTYNRRDLLLEALPAVLAQDRPPDLVWVVDNASDRRIGLGRARAVSGRAARPARHQLRRRRRVRARHGAGPGRGR